MTKTLTALLLCLALPPTVAGAYPVGAPFPGSVTATTYYPSGSLHGAVDLTSGAGCGYWGVETAVKASLSWTVAIHNSTTFCSGSSSGVNEAKHTFANGYTFRQRYFLKSASSTSRTCNRCQIGDERVSSGSLPGHDHHLQYDKSGTLNTVWYAGTTQGEYLDGSEVIGNVG